MWELDCEEGWAPKNWCFWTVVLEKTLESPLDCNEIQPVHSEGDQPWDFFGRNDAKAEAPVLWPPHAELTHWKRLSCWEELGARGEGDDRGWDGWMASPTRWTWVEWTPGVGDGQGGLACCDFGVTKNQTWLSDWTEVNWRPCSVLWGTHSALWSTHGVARHWRNSSSKTLLWKRTLQWDCTPGHVEGLLHESLVNWRSLSHRFENDYLSVSSRSWGEIFDSSNSLKIFVMS